MQIHSCDSGCLQSTEWQRLGASPKAETSRPHLHHTWPSRDHSVSLVAVGSLMPILVNFDKFWPTWYLIFMSRYIYIYIYRELERETYHSVHVHWTHVLICTLGAHVLICGHVDRVELSFWFLPWFFQIFTTSILCHFWSCHLGSSRCHSGCSGLQLQYCHAGSRLRPRCHPFEEAQEVLWSSSIVVSGPSWQRIISFFTGLLRQDPLSTERWTDSIRQLNQMDFPLQNIYFGVPPCMEPPKWCYINDVRWCWM